MESLITDTRPRGPLIALVEPFWTGHPETQLRLFAKALLASPGNRVLILCQRPEAMQAWIQGERPGEAHRFFTAPFAYCEKRGTYPNQGLATWARAGQALQISAPSQQ